ncbi:MAG: NAD-dependent epimerase/dehydratase family protein [Rhodothermales bacterium]|nr:NAD-dependent epimerase/dehydratase family protein [Rhodothermales bacterium]MBO6778477.1 NAD-dependent epimerase/dehydratase family protein [Rhodothermales bacterium]
MTTRRQFLQSAALVGAGLSAFPSRAMGSFTKPRRLLILGGTGFIGPHMVRYALERGHDVTIFNRGRTNTHLFPDVEKLVGDRAGDLSALEGRRWDVVIDNHATLPGWVRRSAGMLKDAADQYVHVSTISVYAPASFDGAEPGSDAEQAARIHEDSPLSQLPADHDGGEEVTGATYGPFKWMAEGEARQAFGDERTTIVRPGLIVGPGDPTDRFTYWPARLDRGGRVLAPGDGRDPVQFIDARDLTAWIVRLAEGGTAGVFNGTGPAGRLSMRGMLEAGQEAVGKDATLEWVPADFLSEHGVRPWGDMPVWIPSNPLTFVQVERAVQAGLTFRPIGETFRDTLAWHKARPEAERAEPRAGLPADREAEVLTAWDDA